MPSVDTPSEQVGETNANIDEIPESAIPETSKKSKRKTNKIMKKLRKVTSSHTDDKEMLVSNEEQNDDE